MLHAGESDGDEDEDSWQGDTAVPIFDQESTRLEL
jgi:hypothetical protein